MKTILILTAFLGTLAAGCGLDRTLDPGLDESAWTLVRFHDSGEATGPYDLDLFPSGSVELSDGGVGGELSARGLLAGERLETIARLIGSLPLHSYSSGAGCPSGGFFVSVTRDGRVDTYSSGPCDESAPESLLEIRGLLAAVANDFRQPRSEPVPFRTLLSGTRSSIDHPRRVIVRSVDALLQLLRENGAGGPIAVPQVNFRTHAVIGLFAGERPSGGFDLIIESAERTESDWIRLFSVAEEPGPGCIVSAGRTQPFVIFAVEIPKNGFLFESRISTTRCE